MATDRKVSTELEKLGKLVSTLVEGMSQLQLDVAKMSARNGGERRECDLLGHGRSIAGALRGFGCKALI